MECTRIQIVGIKTFWPHCGTHPFYSIGAHLHGPNALKRNTAVPGAKDIQIMWLKSF